MKFKILTVILMLMALPSSAHLVEKATGVDTLSSAERFTLKTNAVDWLLLTPNVSMEYDLQRYNWSRWALQLDLKGSPKTTNAFNQDFDFHHSQVRLELRNYWRTRQLTNRFIPHKYPWQKLFSTRRLCVKHPNTTYFRGVYASYDHLFYQAGTKDFRGDAYGVGFTYGIVKPLVQYQKGNSIDLELSVSAGAAYCKGVSHSSVSEESVHRFLPAVHDLRVGFAYRFGSYPSYKKYRYRYDVDMSFQDVYDDKMTRRDTRLRDIRTNRTVVQDMEDMFWDLYNKETGWKQVVRTRNKADRTGLDPDIASEKAVDNNRRKAIADSLAIVERHEREAEVTGKEADVYERIKVYEETYNPKTRFGRDIQPIQKANRKAAKLAAKKAREEEKKERKRQEEELKKARQAERAAKLAAQEKRMKEKAEERAARKAAEKAERDEQKAQSEAKKKADKEAARAAADKTKAESRRQKNAEKKANEEIKAEAKKIEAEAKKNN